MGQGGAYFRFDLIRSGLTAGSAATHDSAPRYASGVGSPGSLGARRRTTSARDAFTSKIPTARSVIPGSISSAACAKASTTFSTHSSVNPLISQALTVTSPRGGNTEAGLRANVFNVNISYNCPSWAVNQNPLAGPSFPPLSKAACCRAGQYRAGRLHPPRRPVRSNFAVVRVGQVGPSNLQRLALGGAKWADSTQLASAFSMDFHIQSWSEK